MALDPSPNVRQFIETNIDSVELLHVLMFLVDRPSEAWPLSEISRELRSTESSVTMRVRTLIGRKVLAADALSGDKAVYRPSGTEVDAAIAETMAFYKLAPYRVVEMIFSRHTSAIQSIAEAFRFRKEE